MSEHTAEPAAAKRLERPHDGRMLAGVCEGLARYFGIHPTFYRVGFVVLTLIGGAGIFVYVAAALVIPDEGKEDSIASAALRDSRDRPWPLIGLGLVAVAGTVLLSRATIWPHGDVAWILLLLAGGTILWLTRRVRPAAPRVDAATEAAPESAPRTGRLLRRFTIASGALLAFVLIAMAVFAAVFHVHVWRGIGDRTYAPAGVVDLQRSYRLGIGDLRLDLRNVRLPVGETRVSARVDVGDLRVVVPSDAALRIRGEAQLGYVNLLGVSDDGRNVRESLDETGERLLVLNVHVGVGSVRVTRAVR